MPRQARVIAVDVPHHITHRGNNRQQIFLSDEDRRRYQDLLRAQLAPCAVDLLGWCWMNNHVHLIAVPRLPNSLSRLIMQVHSCYAQAFNRRYERSGHLWQSRFFSCILGPAHLRNALLYVDQNPVRAQLTGSATAWSWSSAGAHANGADPDALLSRNALSQYASCENWEARLRDPIAADALARLRDATRLGRPYANPQFVAELEHRLKAPLTPKPRGRPKKAISAAAGSL